MRDTNGAAGQTLERLAALQRNLMRRFANEEGLQLVHVEIMQYLSICNRYSDTTQSVSEYLGQTKGSISQSLGHLEESAFIKRTQDKADGRVFHLTLSAKGRSVAERLLSQINYSGADSVEAALKSLLRSLQITNGLKGFGACNSCMYNKKLEKHTFICGLTNEKLSIDDCNKICREHEFERALRR